MAKNFTPIRVWTEPGKRYAGRAYLNEHGQPITGIVERETKNTKTRTICRNGNHLASYTYPKALCAPVNQMISWENTTMCGGYALVDYDDLDRRTAEAVFRNEKPVGDIFSEDIEQIAKEASAKGFAVKRYPTAYPEGTTLNYLQIGVQQPLFKLFDLDAIADYYDKATDAGSSIREALKANADKTPMEVLAGYDWKNSWCAFELALTGLCLGYALESTVSVINNTNR